MFPLPRKLLALYLIASTTFTPLAPVFAAATPTTTNSHQQLPELGSAATSQQKTASASRATQTPEWMLHAATDQDLGPSALRNRAQGIEQAVAQGASMLSHAASDAAEQWFTRRHITAELALKSDQHGIHGGSLDMLVPFYQAGKNLLFTQVGIRRSNSYTENYRNTLNLGLGYRRNFAGWLLGANSFYDRDTTAKDGRLGAGVEAWTDYLKLSANSYLPLSGWKTTPERAGYQERAARGWDVRAEGYLPSYPQLGGKLIYEQYYGKGVSLFSANDRQENPRALTLGMIYNPIPLIGLGINHRIGQGGLADTSANLTLSYRLGESMAKQLSSSSMKARYLLENMRYDLVARNNEIVLNNRARAEQMRLPKEISGAEGHSVQFSLSSSVALQSLNWVGSAAAFALPYDGSGTATLHMPNYVSGLTNTYGLQAVGIDKNGRTVTSNLMTVSVHAVDFSISAQPAAILANGLSTTTLRTTIKSSEGQAVGAGMSVNWTTSAGKLASASSITNANGVATNTLTSATQAGTATVEASAASGKSSTTVDFIADAPASGNKGISLQANPASITANGSSSTIIRASLQDEQGNPVGAGVMVNWHASAGALASAATNTDANGIASVVLTSAILAGPATIDASAGQAHNSTSVTFTPGAAAAGNSGLQLTLSSAAITADGTSSTTLSATVLDAHNNPVSAGTVVNWTTSAGTLASPSSVTNSSGIASVVLTSSTKAGSATLHATSGSANNTTTVAFIPGAPAAGNQGLALTVTSAFASDTATLIATVQDSYGNPVGAGVAVTWATTAGALAGTTSLTDSSGIARMLLTATAVGQMATVNASAGAAYDSESVAFHAGVPAVGSNGISLAVGADDGSGTTALTASVRDAYGNAVGAGIAVNWTTSQGTLASATSITDANGMASMALTSTLGSTATVQATTGHAHDSINVVFMPGTPASGNNGISLAASPASLTADGTSTSTLTASVRDAKGNSVGAGVNVNWATNLGALSSATSSTDANGVATVVLTAATVPGTANVQATTGTASNQTNVRFIPGSPAAGSSGLSLTADPTSVPADGSSTTTLRATVRDNLGNPVAAGVAVSWTTSDGTLASATSVTDDNGVAQMLLTSSTQVGIAAVQAAAGAAGNALNVEFVDLTPVPAALTLTPSLTSLTANGASTSVLKAVVLDTKGKPMPAGTPVNWTTTAGSLASATSNTDASGVATVVLTSSVVAGQANVTATAGAASGAATVLYTAGPMAKLTVTPSPAELPADGASKSSVSTLVTDANGNPLGAGITVTWTLTSDRSWAPAGSLSSTTSVTNASGVATVEMTARTWTGTSTITASSSAIQGTAVVAFKLSTALSATTMSIPKNGQSTVSVVVKGPDGRPAPGVVVYWDFYGTYVGNVKLSAKSAVTDSNGVATVVVTNTSTESPKGVFIGVGFGTQGNSSDMIDVTLE